MIILDTCALVFDAQAPERLSAQALRAIEEGEKNGDYFLIYWKIVLTIF